MIARLSESFLRDVHDDPDAAARLYAANKTLAQKILDVLKDIGRKIRDAFKGISPQSELGRIGEKMAQEHKALLDLYAQGIRKAADNMAYTENTTGEGGVRNMAREDNSFNDYAVSSAIWDALDHQDMHHDNLIKVSKMPQYIQSLLGITGDFYVQRNHTYENTVTEEQAKAEGRFSSKAHYHAYGVEKMERAILSIDHPIMTIATRTNDGNPTVIMILDEFGNNGAPLYAVMSFYSNKPINGKHDIKPHVVLTIAEREWISKGGRTGYDDIIRNAINEKRVIGFDNDKKDELSVIAQTTSLGNITTSSLKDSLSQFRKEINTYKKKNKIMYQSRDADYLSAVERGDMATAQKMVDEAAKEAGYTIKAYHGTGEDFIVFDITKSRSWEGRSARYLCIAAASVTVICALT